MFKLKTKLALILTVLFVIQIVSICGTYGNVFAEDIHVAEEDFMYGDVNGDGDINSLDFAYMRRYILGFIKEFPSVNGNRAADVDGNGSIDSLDFAYMRRYVLEIIKEFPVNKSPVTLTPTPTVSPTPINLKANAGTDIVTYKSFKVSLDGSLSTFPEGEPVSFKWRIVSKPVESNAALDNPSVYNPSFVADAKGEYVLGLTVSAGMDTSDEALLSVKVKEIGATTDDIDESFICEETLTGYDFEDFIPLSDGWIIAKDQTLNKVIFKNVFSGEHGKEFSLQGKPNKMEYDFEREMLLVSLTDINMIAKINMRTEEITYISINGEIIEMTLGERGIIFVMTGTKIYAVDAEKEKVLSSVNGSYNLATYDKYGNNLFVAVAEVSPCTLARYSFNEKTKELELQQSSRELGSNARDIAISNDGKHLVLCCGGGNGYGYTIFDIDSSDITQKFGEWNVGIYPRSAEFSLDDKYLVASNGFQIKIFDVETYSEISLVSKVTNSKDDLCFSRGGKIIYNFDGENLHLYRSGIVQSEVAPPQIVISPIAYTTADKSTLKGLVVKLDGSISDRGTGSYLEYNWEMVSKPENSQSVLKETNSSTPTFIPDMPGQYRVSLFVCNEAGESDIAFVNITVQDMMETVDEIGNIEDGYLEGYVSIKPIALPSGWIIAADTENVIKFVNVLTGEVANQYQLSDTPSKLSFDFESYRIIASLTEVNKIAVIDIGKDTIYYINTPYSYQGIAYGENNIAFAISKGKQSAYISVIDINKKEVLNSINVSVYNAGLIEYDKNNNNLFIADRGVSPSSLRRYSFDETTNELKFEQGLPMGGNGIDLSISSDGKHVILCSSGGNGNGYTIFDVDATDIEKKFGEFVTDAYPTSGAFTYDEKHFVASNGWNLLLFDASNYNLITSMNYEGSPGVYDKVLFSRGNRLIIDVIEDRIYYFKNPLYEYPIFNHKEK